MTYRTMATTLLISAPSDVPDEDLATVRLAVSQWNVSYGRAFGLTIIPVSWTEHAVSEFGERPQEIINKQLVDFADIALALFADRLGTDTGKAVSGTWEEVEEMARAGKPVSVLRNMAPRATTGGTEAAAERLRLEEHLRDNAFPQALVLNYSNQAQLASHVNNMLSRVVSNIQQRLNDDSATDDAATSDDEDPELESEDESKAVWPRIETSEYVDSDSKGRLRTRHRSRLVLSNTSRKIARNVRFEFDTGGETFNVRGGDDEVIDVLPPGGEVGFPLLFVLGSVPQATCIVTWEDADGDHRVEATVRR